MDGKQRINVGELNPDFEIAKSEMEYMYWVRLQEHIRDVAFERFGENWRQHCERIIPVMTNGDGLEH